MFQSPENSVSQDEHFSLKTSTQLGVTDGSPFLSFSLSPTSSSSCSHTTAVLEAPSQLSQTSSSQTSAPAAVTSTEPAPFIQLTAPQQIPDMATCTLTAQAPDPKHYVALPPSFLQSDGSTQAATLAPPIVAAPPPVALALTTTAPGAAAAAAAATTTDALSAVAPPVPLATNPAPISGPGLAPITIAPTQSLLQPSLVMSEQNLQWILSSATNSQQNPDQVVSSAPMPSY